jgi:hypothetical protein
MWYYEREVTCMCGYAVYENDKSACIINEFVVHT